MLFVLILPKQKNPFKPLTLMLSPRFKDWWFSIRPSNTEPYLRFIAEAKSEEKLNEVVATTHTIIDLLNS